VKFRIGLALTPLPRKNQVKVRTKPRILAVFIMPRGTNVMDGEVTTTRNIVTSWRLVKTELTAKARD